MTYKNPAFIKPDWSIGAIEQRIKDDLAYSADSEKLLEHAHNLLGALGRIMQMEATSPLEACAYQGPPPKKWLREVAPVLEARYNAVKEAQKIAHDAINSAISDPNPVE